MRIYFLLLLNQSAFDHQIIEMYEAKSENFSFILITERHVGLHPGAMLILFDCTVRMAGWTPN
jgi:hypothetical protein